MWEARADNLKHTDPFPKPFPLATEYTLGEETAEGRRQIGIKSAASRSNQIRQSLTIQKNKGLLIRNKRRPRLHGWSAAGSCEVASPNVSGELFSHELSSVVLCGVGDETQLAPKAV